MEISPLPSLPCFADHFVHLDTGVTPTEDQSAITIERMVSLRKSVVELRIKTAGTVVPLALALKSSFTGYSRVALVETKNFLFRPQQQIRAMQDEHHRAMELLQRQLDRTEAELFRLQRSAQKSPPGGAESEGVTEFIKDPRQTERPGAEVAYQPCVVVSPLPHQKITKRKKKKGNRHAFLELLK